MIKRLLGIFFVGILLSSCTQSDSNQVQSKWFFQANKGQVDEQVQYLLNLESEDIYFTKEGVTFDQYYAETDTHFVVKQKYVPQSNITLLAENKQKATISYMKGNQEDKWLTGIETFAELRYMNAYDDVDVVFAVDSGRVFSRYFVASTDLISSIRIKLDGCLELNILSGGDLECRNGKYYRIFKRPTLEAAELEYVIYDDYVYGFELLEKSSFTHLVIEQILY